MSNTDTEVVRKCAYCGSAGPGVEVSMHSGQLECGSCWNWRKLDGPAALHWEKVAKLFFSNVDMYDLMTFFPKTLGIDQDEQNTLFSLMRKLEVNNAHAIALRYNNLDR